MKKLFLKRALVITVISFFIGLSIILVAQPLATKWGTEIVEEREGFTISNSDPELIEAMTISLVVVGSLISLTGGAGLLMSGYLWYKQLEDIPVHEVHSESTVTKVLNSQLVNKVKEVSNKIL